MVGMTSPHHPPQAGQPVTAPQQPAPHGYGPPPQTQPQQTWPQPPPSYPVPHQFAGATAPVVDTGAKARKLAGWVTIAGAAVVIVGSVLPWASVMLVGPVYGTEGDGILTIVCAVIVALMALPAALGKGGRWLFGVAAFFGIVAAGIAGYDLSNISALVSEESMASLGPGLPVIIAGGLVILGASVVGIAKGKRP